MLESNKQRLRLRVTGVVQGVGFRPFVYNLAQRHQLMGFVGNDSAGVFIEVEGDATRLQVFRVDLERFAPPLAHIEKIISTTMAPQGAETFTIVESKTNLEGITLISPDLCICDDCLQELLDPYNRRYRYPFINCTNCGPRFTITRQIPYDRPNTTMADFPLCDACTAEYHDPSNRRFHAQPNACADCGPQVRFIAGEVGMSGENTFLAAQSALCDGKILAVKGLGGMHLACDATNYEAINRLRKRKGRPAKPFALMVCDLAEARRYAIIDDEAAKLLTSRERPIVLLRKRDRISLAANIAPHNPYIGIMLPYTPLHYLLLHELGCPLIMTSGNYSGEPMVIDNATALQQLAPLVDAFLLHNRDIHVPCDDSVLRVTQAQEYPIRRSRGYAPFPVKLPFDMPPILAVGGELKNTFCLTRDNYAFISQHIGDMGNIETLTAFEQAFQHMKALFRVEPQLIACDMHPNYLTSRWAHKYSQEKGLPLIKVQHHHAHIAAVMAEHGLDVEQQVIGICFDGTGYGTDMAIWGGEIFVADYQQFKRVRHLKYVPLAGGDIAVQKPYRMALTQLWAADINWDVDLPCVVACPEQEQMILHHQLTNNFNTVPTSSIGRLFDAVAALIGVRQIISYDAQAAIELESMATLVHETPYRFIYDDDKLDPKPMLQAIIKDMRAGIPATIISGRFHLAVADMILQVALEIRSATCLNIVILSGGVFQNLLLLHQSKTLLFANGFDVLIHRCVPANDGGIAIGQASITYYRLSQ